MSLEGKVWRYGDNIDTDVIIPARYLNSFDPKDLAAHCMEDSDEHQDAPFASNVVEGDIMVGGKNFGCGSSREHAPIAIKAAGVPVVIAADFDKSAVEAVLAEQKENYLKMYGGVDPDVQFVLTSVETPQQVLTADFTTDFIRLLTILHTGVFAHGYPGPCRDVGKPRCRFHGRG